MSIKNVVSPKIDPEGDQKEWYPLGIRQKWDSNSHSSLRENLANSPDVQLDAIISLIHNKNNHEAAHTLIKIINNVASLSEKEPKNILMY